MFSLKIQIKIFFFDNVIKFYDWLLTLNANEEEFN